MNLLVDPVELVASSRWDLGRRGLRRALIFTDRLLRRLRNRESSAVAIVTGRLLAQRGALTFRLHCGAELVISSADDYWLRPLLFEGSYEPDIDALLSGLLTEHDSFVDCGANLGIWSVAASMVISDPARVLAIESSSSTFAQLTRNQHLNHDRFTVLQRALSDVDDQTVEFYSSASDHASSSVFEHLAPVDSTIERVRTIALTTLLESMRQLSGGVSNAGMIVVKLDVEGLEARLLESLDATSDWDVIVIYEDHGRDPTHATTAAVLAHGFEAAYIGDDGSLHWVDAGSIGKLDALMWNPRRGYNFVAVAPAGSAAARLRRSLPGVPLA